MWVAQWRLDRVRIGLEQFREFFASKDVSFGT